MTEYIDDTFAVTTAREALDILRRTFEECSVLHFTCEFPADSVLPFLDVKVTQNQDLFSTSVYRKPTNIGVRHEIMQGGQADAVCLLWF